MPSNVMRVGNVEIMMRGFVSLKGRRSISSNRGVTDMDGPSPTSSSAPLV